MLGDAVLYAASRATSAAVDNVSAQRRMGGGGERDFCFARSSPL